MNALCQPSRLLSHLQSHAPLSFQGDDARREGNSLSSSSGNHQTLPSRPWRSSQPSDEDKGSACSGYASPSSAGTDGPRTPFSMSGTPDPSGRHRHLTAAAVQRERDRAKHHYAEDPLSSASPPRSTSAPEDDYLEPHNAASVASQPWSSSYVNTTPFQLSPPPGATRSNLSTFLPSEAVNPEYMHPNTSDYLGPNPFSALPSNYYNEDVFHSPPPQAYQNLGHSAGEDTSAV